jgi:hypothetical protein
LKYLSSEKLVSSLCFFKCNLRRYVAEARVESIVPEIDHEFWDPLEVELAGVCTMDAYKLNAHTTQFGRGIKRFFFPSLFRDFLNRRFKSLSWKSLRGENIWYREPERTGDWTEKWRRKQKASLR